MPNALKKINARVKVLQKKHPNAKRSTLQKQAGREWTAGKLKAKRKPAPKKVKRTVRRKAAKRKPAKKKVMAVAKVAGIGSQLKRVKWRTRRTVRRAARRVARRVSGRVGKKDSLMPVLLIGGLGLAAYLLLRPATTVPAIVQTSNAQRNAAANNILSYATAAGLTINALAALVKQMNAADDNTVIAAGANPQAALGTDFFTGD